MNNCSLRSLHPCNHVSIQHPQHHPFGPSSHASQPGEGEGGTGEDLGGIPIQTAEPGRRLEEGDWEQQTGSKHGAGD